MSDYSFDKSDLRSVLLNYPKQLELGRSFAEKITFNFKADSINQLVICGMGGSALPGDLLSSVLTNSSDKFSLPIYIQRTYNLNKNVNENTLVFISSYSGNTEEPISCFYEALSKKAKIVAFSVGGKVESIAKENKVPHVKYLINFKNFEPRYATTYAMMAMNEVLTKLNLSDRIEFQSDFDPSSLEKKGEILAQKTKNRTPIIYASDRFKCLAKFWKTKLNENSKIPAFWNYFPELNHNEMVGFTNPQADFFVIMLKDDQDHPQIKKRMEITSKLYSSKNIPCQIIEIEGKNYLEKAIFCSSYGDWHSYYLAKEYGQDPIPVDMVEDLKKDLEK